jgi:putative ABC transport system permease protein
MFEQTAAILRFAWKMVLHERAKTLAAVLGVAFAVCLVLVQIGLYIGFLTSMALLINHSSADLWVVPSGVHTVEHGLVLPEHDAYLVRSLPGVAKVEPLVVALTQWHLPNGGAEAVEIVGIEPGAEMLRPWNVREGNAELIQRDRNVLIDTGDLAKLHITGVGDQSEIFMIPRAGMQARIVGLTEKVRTFTSNPIVMTGIKNARAFTCMDENGFTSLLVRTAPGVEPRQVQQAILASSDRVEAFTGPEFAARVQKYWDENTGVGMVLYTFAVLGVVIGVGTVAMIQYISTLDHLHAYATLKALGAPNRRVIALVTVQSLVIGLCGYGLGLGLASLVQRGLEQRLLIVELTRPLLIAVFTGSLVFCTAASLLPALKIIRTDPEIVFRA